MSSKCKVGEDAIPYFISSITYNYLNLHSKITVKKDNGTSLKRTFTYTYDATGNKLKKGTLENNASIPFNDANYTTNITTTTQYISGFVYESKAYSNSSLASLQYSDVLQFTSHEEGRIRPVRDGNNNITGFVYDYFLKDHLGNVRMVLNDEQKMDHYPTATLEGTGDGSPLSKEEDYYDINESYVVDKPTTTNPSNLLDYINDNGTNNPDTFGNKNAISQKMYRLNANTNRTGMSRILQVMAGDKIDILAKSYYKYGGTVTNNTFDAGDIINAFLAVTGGGNVAVQHGATSPLLNANNSGLVLPLNGFTDNNPVNANNNVKAGINYIILDAQFNFVTGGFDPVNDDVSGGLKSHFLQDISIPKNGYIYIYCSNESNIDVFFDNLEVVHTRGPILEETHYYPFGLTMAGISSKAFGGVENKFKYNGIERNKDFDLNTYKAFYRTHDRQIGRWRSLDPKPNVSISGYSSMQNNPVRYADPFGDTATVRWDTGFLGLRRHEARYVGGQWINSKTRSVININDVGRRGARRIMNDYTTLNGIKDFSPVTTTVNNATNEVRLRWRGGSQTDAPKYFNDLSNGVSNPTIRVSASRSESLPEEVLGNGSNKNMPSYMILGHELGHAWDLLNSGNSNLNFLRIKNLPNDIAYSEVNAMYWENVLRLNAGMPLRFFYHYDKSQMPQFQLKANVSYSRERVMLGGVPYFKLITTISDLMHTNTLSR